MDIYPPRELSLGEKSSASLADVEKQLDSEASEDVRSDHIYKPYCNQNILQLVYIINFLGVAFFIVSYGLKEQSTKSLAQSLEIGSAFSSEIDMIPLAEPKKVASLNLPQNGTTNAPRIAWLLSFPNSGTTYTMELAASVSTMTMATNYGTEQNTRGLHEKYPSLNSSVMPVFQDWKGPFWVDPLRPHPEVTVLTKTHCGGYCGDCLPIENADSFLSHCATGNELRGIHFEYDLTQVKVDRAVHLIRDPIDNIVARYHYHAKKVLHRNEAELVKRYTYDSKGFANYCEDSLDVLLHRNEVPDDYPLDDKMIKELQDIPCFVDLFRYIQWHNLAFLTTQESLKIPTLVIHYEEYSNNLNGTLVSLLNFLELPLRGTPAEFVSGKSYHDYFSHDQRSKIRHATKLLSSPTAWSYLQRYF